MTHQRASFCRWVSPRLSRAVHKSTVTVRAGRVDLSALAACREVADLDVHVIVWMCDGGGGSIMAKTARLYHCVQLMCQAGVGDAVCRAGRTCKQAVSTQASTHGI